ncbi:MAG: hypothetical protein GWM98_12005 [Nitrospinaceae bacterium]|nr:hypothetical protein [Nitrospinaceae bacterium]NIR55087.1 hypothetical protein [Nitrospinaceae bacterium]NIS85496.1 hypothetical protein [Nitrospinaceae bacterium]NIT82339.1 hypothetical protein [Nitrospinaceae bacterium]NIU44552.1 hypothetical protein [Nitrospinaceae bacterium]
MKIGFSFQRSAGFGVLAVLLILSGGCTSTLVQDPVQTADAPVSHCEGSEGVDDSSVAVLPVPVVAFFVPHSDVNEIKADQYLHKCGNASRLINRKVEVNRTGCVPAGLTRIITLGIWQWCPANVSWEADVVSQ